MKIAITQIKPVNGDIPANIARHTTLIEQALSNGADLIVFPELSITGYEPTIAKELAIESDDHRLNVFQDMSDANNVTIAVGAPTMSPGGVCISLVIFQPNQLRQFYSKMHLHVDEEPFFVPGPRTTGIIGKDADIALAICYEVSIPEHAANAFNNGAKFYIASVADPVHSIERVLRRVGEIAREYSMTVMLSNCVGHAAGWEWAGRSSVWINQGTLLAQLDDADEGILLVDTRTQKAAKIAITSNRH